MYSIIYNVFNPSNSLALFVTHKQWSLHMRKVPLKPPPLQSLPSRGLFKVSLQNEKGTFIHAVDTALTQAINKWFFRQ